MMKLWFLFLALCCVLATCEERLEDKMVEEDKELGEENLSSFGGTVLSNKFSSGTPPVASDQLITTTMDTNTTLVDGSLVTTVSSKDVVSTETKMPVTVSNPPPTFTTHKIDPKKDVKKKNKPTFKKKDKNLDEEEVMEMNHESKFKMDETTTPLADTTEIVTENVPLVETTHADLTITEAAVETTTASQETTEKPDEDDTMPLGREESDITTTGAVTLQGDMLSDKQETTPQTDLFETTMIPEAVHETMTDTKETESSQTTTNEPTTVETTLSPREAEATTTPEVLIVTENNEAATTINSIPVDPVTEVLLKSGKSEEMEEVHTVATETENTFTTAQEDEINSDQNNLNNDLGSEEVSHETTTVHPEMEDTTSPPTVRKQKQMDLDNPEGPCLCDEHKVVVSCEGDRTLPDPNCPCRATCARQSGESCSPGEPCDEEFGLRCNLQNNTCHGEYKIIFLI
ncbi:IGFBP N-terminal domain-containing protein [Trichonephila clavipes]|nr:IGFBP N-terminal domain-containing protein [Trichonephila clavipes]